MINKRTVCALGIAAGLLLAACGATGPETVSADAVQEEPVPDFPALVFENEKGESAFKLSLEEFIGCYNSEYGEEYLTPPGSDGWLSYAELSPCFGCDAVRHRFSEDREVWPMPTLSVYTAGGGEICEVRMTFDDHGYQEKLHDRYKEMVCCLLSMACRSLTDEETGELFNSLYELSHSNFFGDHCDYADPERPALSTVYRYGNIGFYCFYGPGNVEICMIPLTETAVGKLLLQGTEIIEI